MKHNLACYKVILFAGYWIADFEHKRDGCSCHHATVEEGLAMNPKPSIRLYYDEKGKFMVKAYKNSSGMTDSALRKLTIKMLERALRRVKAYPGVKGRDGPD